MGKCTDGLPYRLGLDRVEIKQDWQQVVFAKSVSKPIQYGFSLRSKSTENKDRFRGHGVNNITNFGIVQQEVNELCNLEIINRDGWLTCGCDRQIKLFGSIKLYVPGRDAVNGTILQSGLGDICSDYICSAEVSSAEVSSAD